MAITELDTLPRDEAVAKTSGTTRRSFLLKLGFLLNGVAATMVSVPLLGYLLSAFRNDGG